ncbi:hypothetical protein GQ607_003532 [Colletotrichum asianum]|uniref:Uncharacterized protein n=1 Tax=Colletotrichum asianum TaxID=702518 RepID=A0A8H3WRF7_9PEZI|nr:hypothetical protein GQ607_003532 [Colletotrichum asianum]
MGCGLGGCAGGSGCACASPPPPSHGPLSCACVCVCPPHDLPFRPHRLAHTVVCKQLQDSQLVKYFVVPGGIRSYCLYPMLPPLPHVYFSSVGLNKTRPDRSNTQPSAAAATSTSPALTTF